LRAAMAWSEPSLISTNAKPRGRPVSRSMMTCTLVTVPYWENNSRSWSSVVEKAMLPTYRLFAIASPSRGRGGGCPGGGWHQPPVYPGPDRTPQQSRVGRWSDAVPKGPQRSRVAEVAAWRATPRTCDREDAAAAGRFRLAVWFTADLPAWIWHDQNVSGSSTCVRFFRSSTRWERNRPTTNSHCFCPTWGPSVSNPVSARHG